MRIFGYGSLMCEDWQTQFGCVGKVLCTLTGFVRTFDKASRKNWGTREHPGPTVRLKEQTGGECRGFVYEFPEPREKEVLDYLNEREGRGFEAVDRLVTTDGGDRLHAFAYHYRGRHTLEMHTLSERAIMARRAVGEKGSCVIYVADIQRQLRELGIVDTAVEAFADAVHGIDPHSA